MSVEHRIILNHWRILTASVIANLVTIALAIFVALIKSVEAPVVTKTNESIYVATCTIVTKKQIL